MRGSLLGALAPLLLAGWVHAAEIGLSSTPGSLQQTGMLPVFQPTSIYVVVQGAPAQVDGLEYGIDHDGTALFLGVSYSPPQSICVTCPVWDDYISGFGACYAPGPSWTFANISLMWMQALPAEDLSFCMTPASVSSFVPPAAGLHECGGTLQPLDPSGGPVPAPGCVVLNPKSIATERESWSAIKGRFAGRD